MKKVALAFLIKKIFTIGEKYCRILS